MMFQGSSVTGLSGLRACESDIWPRLDQAVHCLQELAANWPHPLKSTETRAIRVTGGPTAGCLRSALCNNFAIFLQPPKEGPFLCNIFAIFLQYFCNIFAIFGPGVDLAKFANSSKPLQKYCKNIAKMSLPPAPAPCPLPPAPYPLPPAPCPLPPAPCPCPWPLPPAPCPLPPAPCPLPPCPAPALSTKPCLPDPAQTPSERLSGDLPRTSQNAFRGAALKSG